MKIKYKIKRVEEIVGTYAYYLNQIEDPIVRREALKACRMSNRNKFEIDLLTDKKNQPIGSIIENNHIAYALMNGFNWTTYYHYVPGEESIVLDWLIPYKYYEEKENL